MYEMLSTKSLVTKIAKSRKQTPLKWILEEISELKNEKVQLKINFLPL